MKKQTIFIIFFINFAGTFSKFHKPLFSYSESPIDYDLPNLHPLMRLKSRLLFCDPDSCSLIKHVKLHNNYDCLYKKLGIFFNISFIKNGTETQKETVGYIPFKTSSYNSDEINLRNELDSECRVFKR